MKCLSFQSTLLIISSVSILTAMSLIGASLTKSIKWNFYKYELNYGTNWFNNASLIYYLHAYQTLWTSYDAWTGHNDQTHMQVFKPIKDDSWRLLPRLLIIATLILGALSFGVLLTGSLVSCSRRKSFVLNCFRIASSVLSISAGSLLVYTLIHYLNNYKSILAYLFDDPTTGYPDKSNLSTGFYLATFATIFFFISAVVNIANVIILLKAGTAPVQPIQEGSKEI